MPAIILTLPLPPTANHLFANVKGYGRTKTAAYKRWIHEAGWELAIQRAEHIAGWYDLAVYLPADTNGDSDNRIKALSDLLGKHGVISDDSYAWSVRVYRTHSIAKGCRVELRAVPEDERAAA